MKKKILGYVLLVLGIILIGFGSYSLLTNNSSNNNTNNTNNEEQTEERNTSYSYNDNSGANKEQCDDVICIKDISILSDGDEINFFNATAYSKNKKAIKDYYFTFVFDLGDSKITVPFVIDEMKKNEEYPIILGDSNDEFMKIQSYSIREATDEEIAELNASYED